MVPVLPQFLLKSTRLVLIDMIPLDCVFLERSLDEIPNKAVVAAMAMDVKYDVELADPQSPQHSALSNSLTDAVSCV